METNASTLREKRPLLVLFASETGNGEDIALDVAMMAERLHFMVRVEEMGGVEVVCYFPTFLSLKLEILTL